MLFVGVYVIFLFRFASACRVRAPVGEPTGGTGRGVSRLSQKSICCRNARTCPRCGCGVLQFKSGALSRNEATNTTKQKITQTTPRPVVQSIANKQTHIHTHRRTGGSLSSVATYQHTHSHTRAHPDSARRRITCCFVLVPVHALYIQNMHA